MWYDPPRPLRTVFAVIAVLGLGLFTYVMVEVATDVPKNSATIDANCQERSKVVAAINAKFGQLNTLVDLSFEQNTAAGRPPTPEILRLYEEFKKPIPIKPCKALNGTTND